MNFLLRFPAVLLLLLQSTIGHSEPIQFKIAEEERYVYLGDGWKFVHKTRGAVNENAIEISHTVGHVELATGDKEEIPRFKGYSSKHDFRAFAKILADCSKAVEQKKEFEGTACGIIVRSLPGRHLLELDVLHTGHESRVYFTAHLPGDEATKYSAEITELLDTVDRINSGLGKKPNKAQK